MAIQNSKLLSSGVLCSLAALVLAAGCQLEPDENPGVTGGTSSSGTAGAGVSKGGSAGSTGGTAMTGGTSSGTSGSGGSAGAPTGGASGKSGNTSGAGGAGGAAGNATAGTGSNAGGAGGSAGSSPASGGTGNDLGGAGGSAGSSPTSGGTGSGTSGAGGSATTSAYNPDFEEFYGEDCEVGEPQTADNPALPDLFEKFDGTRMSKKSEWRCRRAELKKAVEKYIHGEKPGRPDVVTGTVSATSVSVHVEHDGNSIDFSVPISIPTGAARPAPAIIGLGNVTLDRTILTSEGVATMNYNNNAMASETSRSGLFSEIYGNTGASAQVGWAWGVSRIIDVLVDERAAGRNDIIDPTALGVTGCSRLGKGAFTIGAFDERIALGIPQESGTGGVSAFRVVNTAPMGPNGKPAQSLASAWTEAQGWFGTAFGNYRNDVDSLPVDTHSLVAMYAPRGLVVLDNSRIGELGASAQHAATAAGAQVFKALGVEKNAAYHGGNPSDPHNHCSFYASQAEPLRRAIRAHLTRTAEPDGRIEPQPAGTADLTRWIDWETPVLTDD